MTVFGQNGDFKAFAIKDGLVVQVCQGLSAEMQEAVLDLDEAEQLYLVIGKLLTRNGRLQ